MAVGKTQQFLRHKIYHQSSLFPSADNAGILEL
jgi:hypothetical protein